MFNAIRNFFSAPDAPEQSITEKLIATLRSERDYHHGEIDYLERILSSTERDLHQHYAAATALNNTLSALINPDLERQSRIEWPEPGSIRYSDPDLSAAITGLRDKFRAHHANGVIGPLVFSDKEIAANAEPDMSAFDDMDLAEEIQHEREALEPDLVDQFHELAETDRLQDDPITGPLTKAAAMIGHPIPIHQADTPGVDEHPWLKTDAELAASIDPAKVSGMQ